jgi:hypothetical protein
MICTKLFESIRRDSVEALSATCATASVHVEPAYRMSDGSLGAYPSRAHPQGQMKRF